MFFGFQLVLRGIFTALGMTASTLCLAQPASDELTFQLAKGLSIQQVAGEPLVRWPTLVDWDSQGRLLVVESAGVAHPIAEHNQRGLHRLIRLVDENGDGIMDRRILAADQLPFTEGVLCLGDSILVSAPPHIWRLIDEDGDGFCERREIWFDGQTITGCANDLHGPYLGRDGWIYWSKGAFAQQTHELLDGSTLSDRAAHIFRRHSSGGPIEPVMSGGMDNPVGFAVLPNGERFFSSTFLVHPGDGLRDGVVHSIYGGVYGKDHSALDGVPRTGSLMPIMAHLGPAAPSGLICLRSNEIPIGNQNDSRATLVAALFNLQKVIALPLQSQGASYQTTPIDLIIGSRIDFHPTDVIEDADGSLLIIDTGGWYDLCCPSSRIDQQTAPGGIYRLTSQQTSPRPTSPGPVERANQVSWDELTEQSLVEFLDDRRPWVARAALLEILSRGEQSIPALSQRLENSSLDFASRRNALWALGAIGSQNSLRIVLSHLEQWSQSVAFAGDSATLESDQPTEIVSEYSDLIQIACHLMALHHFDAAQEVLEIIFQKCIESGGNSAVALDSSAAALARVTAEALGRIGDDSSVETLMASAVLLSKDRVLDHSVRYALFEIGSAPSVARFLHSEQPQQVSIALSTLDLLGAEQFLSSEQLLAAAADPESIEAAVSLMRKRPELATELLGRLGPSWHLEMKTQPPTDLFRELTRSWRDRPEMQQWIAKAFHTPSAAEEPSWLWKEVALESLAGHTLPLSWHAWIQAELEASPARMTSLLSSADLKYDWDSPLAAFLVDAVQQEKDSHAKKNLIMCLPTGHRCRDEFYAAQVVSQLAEDPFNQSLWQVLNRLAISAETANGLIDLCDQFSPNDLARAVQVIAAAGNHEVDRRLLQQLSTLPASRSLPREILVNVYRSRPEPIRLLAEQLSDQLQQTDPEVEETVRTVLADLPAGDPLRGLNVYHGSKANCGACHQMGYRGGKIGPELTRIGQSRTREALLEAIIFPSQRIEQGYHSTQILTEDGRILNGIVSGGSTDEILEIQLSADQTERLPVEAIEEIRPSDVSIMPGGMLELLSRQELADLISLLEAAR